MLNKLLDEISKFKVLIIGQYISILIAGTGIFASILSNTHPTSNFPTLMNILNYLLLSTYLLRSRCRVFKSYCCSDSEDNILKSRMIFVYIGATILDLEANFLVLEAYNYTTITSIMLLDCFTIPSAMLISRIFLKCKYTYKHILGALICILGLLCIVLSDTLFGGQEIAVNAMYGDVLCLAGSFMYAASNVLQEYLVKFHDREAFLGIVGSFGIFIGLIQCMILDLPLIEAANFTPVVVGSIAGFVTCLFLMYMNTSAFLQDSDATLFNLSLLTSDVYAVVFSYFMYGELVHWLYFVAFVLVACGLTLYYSEKSPLILTSDTMVSRGIASNSAEICVVESGFIGTYCPIMLSQESEHTQDLDTVAS